MARWRIILRLSADFHEPGDVQAIDATGFDRRAASRRYARRTNYNFRAVNTTGLVDCETSTIIDIRCSMKRPNDTKIREHLLKQNLDQVETITADKGYNWDELRGKHRETGVRPVIKHRGFSSLDATHKAGLDDETYHRRSVVESVIRSLKKRFGDTLRARTWFGQFREIALKAAVKIIETALNPQTVRFRASKHARSSGIATSIGGTIPFAEVVDIDYPSRMRLTCDQNHTIDPTKSGSAHHR